MNNSVHIKRTNDIYRGALQELYGVLGSQWRKTTYVEMQRELHITNRQMSRFGMLIKYLEIAEHDATRGWRLIAPLTEAVKRFEAWADQRVRYGGDMDKFGTQVLGNKPREKKENNMTGLSTNAKTQRDAVLDRWARDLSAVYGLVPQSPQEVATSYETIGKELGLSKHAAIQFKLVLEQAGILGTRLVYRENGRTGRTGYWTLLVPEDEAAKRLAAWSEKRKRTPGSLDSILYPNKNPKVSAAMKRAAEQKAVDAALAEHEAIMARAKELAAQPVGPRGFEKVTPVTVAEETSPEETRAIAGPEAEQPLAALKPLRKDEPRALVAAAEQYADRHLAVEAKYDELVKMGITVDRNAFFGAVVLPVDARLEAVAQVLPYIKSLERAANNLSPAKTKEETRALEQRLSAQREYVKELEDKVRQKDAELEGKRRTIADLQKKLADVESSNRILSGQVGASVRV